MVSINFFWISAPFDSQFAFVGAQNKKVTNFYLVAVYSKAIRPIHLYLIFEKISLKNQVG